MLDPECTGDQIAVQDTAACSGVIRPASNCSCSREWSRVIGTNVSAPPVTTRVADVAQNQSRTWRTHDDQCGAHSGVVGVRFRRSEDGRVGVLDADLMARLTSLDNACLPACDSH